MAHSLTDAPRQSRGFATSILDALSMAMESDKRLQRIRTLQAMSDAELASRGIERDRIVHHVFGPYMFL